MCMGWLTSFRGCWNGAKSELVIDAMCLVDLEKSKPLRSGIRVRSINHHTSGIGCGCVEVCRDHNALDRISDTLLKAHLGCPGNPRIGLTAHDAHRCLPMMNLGQNGLSVFHLVLVDSLIKGVASRLAQRIADLIPNAFPRGIRHR